MNKITEFHVANSYFVDVSKTDSGCFVKFPKNLLSVPTIKEYNVEYKITPNGLSVISDEFTKVFNISPSFKRTSIIVDIILKTLQRNISGSLILVFDGVIPKKKISDILPAPTDKGEALQDKKFIKNCMNILKSQTDYYEMNKIGIGDQYNYLVSLINDGGLL